MWNKKLLVVLARSKPHLKVAELWAAASLPWLLAFGPAALLALGVMSFVPGGFGSLLVHVGQPIIVYLIVIVFCVGLLVSAAALYRHTRAKQEFVAWKKDAPSAKTNATPLWIKNLNGLVAAQGTWAEASRHIELEVRALRDAYLSKLQFPNFLAGSLVGIGLIGTFVGLLGALNDLSNLFGSMNLAGSDSGNPLAGLATMVDQLQNPMKGMGTAFVTSLYGLVGSLLLALSVLIINRTVSAFWLGVANHFRHQLSASSVPAKALASVASKEYPDYLFLQLRMSHEKMESLGAMLMRREEKFDVFLDQLVQVNSAVSKRVLDGSQKLLNQFVELQTEQNANVLLLSRQLKHQQQTLIEAIDKIQKGSGSDARLAETLVIHSNALVNEVSRLVSAVDNIQKSSPSHDELGHRSFYNVSAVDTKTTPTISEKLAKLFARKTDIQTSGDSFELFDTIEEQIKVLDQIAEKSRHLSKHSN